MHRAVCRHCQTVFEYQKKRGRQPTVCSPKCRYDADWAKRKAIYNHACRMCGGGFVSKKRTAEHCSKACAARSTNWRRYGHVPSNSKALVHVVATRRDAASSHGNNVWRNGNCVVCRDWFTTWGTDATCSTTCGLLHKAQKERAKRQRRRARKWAVDHERFTADEIFNRDRYRCHICGRKTLPNVDHNHPRYSTIDHLIPLSLSGPHTRANVATACRICNTIKGARLAGDQLALL